MIKYSYTQENTTIETLNLSDIPEGVAYETIEFEPQEETIEIDNAFLKQQAHELLKATDWYVVRFAETGKPIPQEVIEERQRIRDNY